MAPSFRKVATEPAVRPEIQNQVRAIMQEVKRKVPVSSSSPSSSTSGSPSIFSPSGSESGDEAKTIEEENKLEEEMDQTIAAEESDKVTRQLEEQLPNDIKNLDDASPGMQKRADASGEGARQLEAEKNLQEQMDETIAADESDKFTKELEQELINDVIEFDVATPNVQKRFTKTDEEGNQLEAKLVADINAAQSELVTEGLEQELLHDVDLIEAKEKEEAAAAALPPFIPGPALDHRDHPGVEHNKRLIAVDRPIYGTKGFTLIERRSNRQNVGPPSRKPTKDDPSIRSMKANQRPTADKMAAVAMRSFPESKLMKHKLATRGFKTWVHNVSRLKKEPVTEAETNADRHQPRLKEKQHNKEQKQAAEQQKSIEKAKAHEKDVLLPIGSGAKTKRGHHKRLAAPSGEVPEAQQAGTKNTLQFMRMRVAADLPPTRRGMAASKHGDAEVNKVHAFINKYGKGKDHRDTPEDVVEHLQTMTAEEYRDIQNLDQAAMDKIINDYIAAHPEDVPWIDSIKAAAVAEFNRQSDGAVTLPPNGAPAAEQAATEGDTVGSVIVGQEAHADAPAILWNPNAGLKDRIPTTAPDVPTEVVDAAPPPMPTVPAPQIPVEVEVVEVTPVEVDTVVETVEVPPSPENEAAAAPPLVESREEKLTTPPPEPAAEDIPAPLEGIAEEAVVPKTAAQDNPMIVVSPLAGSAPDSTEEIEAGSIPRGHNNRTIHQYLNQAGKGRYHDHSPPPPTTSQMVAAAAAAKSSPAPIKEGLPAIDSHGSGKPVDQDEAETQATAMEALHHTRPKDFKPRIKEGMVGVEPHALEQCPDSNCPFSNEYQDHAVVEKCGKTRSDGLNANKIHDLIIKHGKGKEHDHTPKPKIEECLHTVPQHGVGAPIEVDEAERQADATEALHHSSPKEFKGLDRDGVHHEGMAGVDEHALEQCSDLHCPQSDYYVRDDCNPQVEKRSFINVKSWLTGGRRIIHKGDLHAHLPAEKEGLPHLKKGGKAEPIPLDEAAQHATADQALTTTSKDVFKPDPEDVEWMKGVGEHEHSGKLPSDAVQKRGCTSWTPLGGGAASIEKRGKYRGEDVFFVKDNKHKTNPDGSPVEEMIGINMSGQAEPVPVSEAEQQAAADKASASSNLKQLKKDAKTHKHVKDNEWNKGVETPSESAKPGVHVDGEYRGENVFFVKGNNHVTHPDGTLIEEGLAGTDKNGQAEPIPLIEAGQQAAADEALGTSNLKQLRKEAKLRKHVEGNEWTDGVETPSDGAGAEQIIDGNEAVSEPVPLDDAAKQADADHNLGNSNLKQLIKEAKQSKHVEGNEWTKGIETPSEPSISKRNAQYAYPPTLNSRPIFFSENEGLAGTDFGPSSKTGLPQNGVPTGAHISNADGDAYATDAAAALNMDHIKDLRNHFGSTGNPNNEVGTKNTKQSKAGVFTKEFMEYVEANCNGKGHSQPPEEPAPEAVPEQSPLASTRKVIFRSHPGENEWIKRFKKDPYRGKMLDVPDKYQKRAALDLKGYRADGEDDLDLQFHPLHLLTHEPVQHGIAKRGAYNAATDTYRAVNGMPAPLDEFEHRVGVLEEDDAKARGYANSRHLAGATARKERQNAAESVKEIAKNLEQERAAEQAAVEEKAENMVILLLVRPEPRSQRLLKWSTPWVQAVGLESLLLERVTPSIKTMILLIH